MRNKKDKNLTGIPIKPVASGIEKEKFTYPKFYPAFLIFSILVIYLPSLKYGFVYDDALFITKNTIVQKGISGIGEVFTHSATFGINKENEGSYRPISLALFATLQEFFPNNPFPFHLLNILCYGISILILYSLLKKILEGYSELFIFSVCLLYTVHPVHTEVVANIKSLDEILAFLFLLLSGWCFVRNTNQNSNLNTITGLVLFLLALLSKENAITFLILVPVFHYFFHKSSLKKTFTLFAILCVPVLTYLFIRYSVLDYLGTETPPDIIDNVIFSAKNFNEKTATAIYILAQYLKLIFIPYPLSIDYSYNQIPIVDWSNWKVLLSAFVLLGSFAGGVLLFLRNKLSGVAILSFFISISIVSHLLIDIRATMAERFLFIPSFTACILIPIGLIQLLNRKNTFQFTKPAFVSTFIIAIVFASISIARVPVWKDNLSLFKSGVISAPKSARTQFLLGNVYLENAEKENDPQLKNDYIVNSLKYSQQCISIHPVYLQALENIGHAYFFLGDLTSAIHYLKLAVAVDPKYMTTTFFLSVCYEKADKLDSALLYNNFALKIDSLDNVALGRQAYLLYNCGEKEADPVKKIDFYNRALTAVDKAILHDSTEAENFTYKGIILVRQNKLVEAISVLKRALELKPDEPRTLKLLGSASGLSGNSQETILYLKRYLETNNPDPEVYSNLSIAYFTLKDYKNAVETADKGLALFPGEPRLLKVKQSIPLESLQANGN
jgi:protein O-mannosyl-transferase